MMKGDQSLPISYFVIPERSASDRYLLQASSVNCWPDDFQELCPPVLTLQQLESFLWETADILRGNGETCD